MLLNELASYLTSTGVALAKVPGSTSTLAYTLYKSFIPDSPDKAIALQEQRGDPPIGKTGLRQPAFRVLVRGAPIEDSTGNYSDARAKIEKVVETLHGFTPSTMNGAYYAGVWADQDPFPTRFAGRPLFQVNFHALRDSTA